MIDSNLPAHVISHYGQENFVELIVMAIHGQKGFEGVLLGSEPQKVWTHSKIPVLVVR